MFAAVRRRLAVGLPAGVRVDPARLVWGTWAALSLSLVWFVLRYGRNLPAWEEWYYVPVFVGDASRFEWLFGRLHEHRYVLGRLVFLLGFDLSGGDFRAGMVLNAVFLSAAAGVLLKLAAELRGRPHAADVLIPAMLLNPAASENLLLGYQVAFTLNVLLAAVWLWLVTRPLSPARSAAWGGLLVVLFALGGWIGLAFVPGGCAWVAFRVWRHVRAGGRRRTALALLLPPLAAAVWFAWCYWDVAKHPIEGRVPNALPDLLRVWAEFLSLAFGRFGELAWPVSGPLAVGLFLTLVVVLGRSAVRDPAALGWLVVLSAVVLMGYGVGTLRPNGFAVRNVSLTVFVAVVGYVVAVRSRLRLPDRLIVPLAVVAAVGFVQTGWQSGAAFGRATREIHDQYDRDRRAGLPLEYLASRHFLFPHPELPDRLRALRAHGHPAAAGVPDGPPVEAIPLPVPPPTCEPIPGDTQPRIGQPPAWRFDLGESRHVVGLRVKLRYRRNNTRAALYALRAGDDSGCAVAASGCFPWLIPYVWEFDFWIDARTPTLWMRPLSEADRFELLEAHLLVPAK